jgi:tetrapyrrole methylase family protein/MazG family protein
MVNAGPYPRALKRSGALVQPPDHLERFESFLEIVKALRGEDGCPWDKEQTHRTLTPYVVEEAHELAEAIESGTEQDVIGELGDVLLQVVLHSEIARQENRFTINDVIRGIGEKMVRRHPHVFGDVAVAGSEDVLKNWTQLKAEEKAKKGASKKETRFDVPLSLPALSRSHKIGDKTKRVGFDWKKPEDVFEKVLEEVEETREELVKPKRDLSALEHEIGDVLFSVSQLARHLGLEAEQCLRTANARFENRYFAMKRNIEASGRTIETMKPTDLEEEWKKIKLSES